MLLDDSQETLSIIRALCRAISERLNKSLNGCDGGLNFVGNIGNELASNIFKPPNACDIV